MCDDFLGLLIVKLPGVDLTVQGLKKFLDKSFTSAIPMVEVLGGNSPIPIFFTCCNTDGVETLYTVKTSKAPLIVTFAQGVTETAIPAVPLDDTDAPVIDYIKLFGRWPEQVKAGGVKK